VSRCGECGGTLINHACEDCGTRHNPGPAETTLPPVALDPDMKKQLQTCGRKVVQWTAERDRLVKEAVAAGGSYREVGAAVGLSHTAVKFIAHGRPR
jgi:hypothetical protein